MCEKENKYFNRYICYTGNFFIEYISLAQSQGITRLLTLASFGLHNHLLKIYSIVL